MKKLNELAFEMSDLAGNALCFTKQMRGIIDAELDLRVKEDNPESWRFMALLTLVSLASEELEKIVSAPLSEEVKP